MWPPKQKYPFGEGDSEGATRLGAWERGWQEKENTFLKYLLCVSTYLCAYCGSVVRNLLQCRRCTRCGLDPWVRNIAWKRVWQPMPVFLPGESRGQRSLAGYSPWGRKELDTTEAHLCVSVCVHTRVHVSVCVCVSVCTSLCVYHPWESRGPGPQREITPKSKVQGRFPGSRVLRGEWALEPGEMRGEPEPQRGKWGLPHKGDVVHAGASRLLEPQRGWFRAGGRPAG